MNRRSKQVAWIAVIAVVAIAGFIGVQSFGLLVSMRSDALGACHAYLESETGLEIDPDDVDMTSIEVFFPKPFDKRFRTTCTYGEATVELESTPFTPWLVIGTSGLD